MKIITNLSELIEIRKNLSEPVGFVPTMGYLHEGHLSLVRQAKQDCNNVIVSIFVNPTQFGPNEDLNSYPRDLERDCSLLREVGTDVVWIPETNEMYPENFQTWVIVNNLTKPLEGARRPDHFRGVTTIVAKLFNAVQPNKAYFGQKDAQQAIVIKRMVKDLNYPIDIVVCPIVREPDGLAMSSRNTYLSEDERNAATVLYRGLNAAKDLFERGVHDADKIRTIVRKTIEAEPLAKLQYVSCADPHTLEELVGEFSQSLLSIAVFVGKTRLIDNIVLQKKN
ncbi:MAG TPA: pantoate--beta-alanine ligase [Anaerolineae bacterium]|nr:pantoate--beta-alanine ligase [Anaerolineae bacterium]